MSILEASRCFTLGAVVLIQSSWRPKATAINFFLLFTPMIERKKKDAGQRLEGENRDKEQCATVDKGRRTTYLNNLLTSELDSNDS